MLRLLIFNELKQVATDTRYTNALEIMNKDLYTMVGLAEGFVEGTELEVIEAWQYLHDSGHAYKLQGWFGRTAQALLEEGIIQ